MTSKAATFPPRTTRKRTLNAARKVGTSGRRNGDVTAARPRRPRVRDSNVAAQLSHPRFGWYAGVTVMAHRDHRMASRDRHDARP